MSTKQEPGIKEGTVYGLFPENSRKFYEECIAGLAEGRNVELSSTLDSKVTDIAEQVWKKIHTAEVVMADITGFDLQIMCEVGMARGLKDSKKILLLCSEAAYEKQKPRLPLDLRGLIVQLYDEANRVQIRQDLAALLNDSLRNRAPANPIDDLNVRQIVERAVERTQAKDFVVAELCFAQADVKLPNHWYIHMNWGVMHREKGDSPEASKLLWKAEDEAEFDEHKAEVYIEQAILEFRDKEASKAEALFERAKSTDKKNRRLYIVWADVLDQLGRPESALGRVTELMETVGKDEETALLTQYYTTKLSNRHFTMSLEEFKKREKYTETRAAQGGSRPKRLHGEASQHGMPSRSGRPRVKGAVKPVPNKITFPDFKRGYRGAIVEGIVKNVHAGIGVFVYIGNFKGLIPKAHLGSNFKNEFRDGDKVRVKVLRAYIRNQDGVEAIDLKPV